MNNAISARLFSLLEEAGVPTHFLSTTSDTGMLIRRLDMFQVEFVVRNIAARCFEADRLSGRYTTQEPTRR